MNDETPVLELRGVRRTFRGFGRKTVVALDGLDLAVPRGSVFGLLGRNGSGKTTALRIALGLLRPDAGEVRTLGEDARSLSAEARRRIGYLSERSFEYDDLPLPDLFLFLSAFFPRWDHAYALRLVERMELPSDVSLAEMSLGTRRRAELCVALAPRPEFLILDDPWLGVDAAARRDFLAAALEAARDDGVTMLFTSHVLTDVERIADRIAIIDHGRLRWQGELDALKSSCKRLVVETPRGIDPAKLVVPGEIRRRPTGSASLVAAAEVATEIVTTAFTPAVLAALRAQGAAVEVEDLNLESAFVEMVREAGDTPSAGAPPLVRTGREGEDRS
jgi:ABC-2 type transport system ATP-binding protein